MSFKKSQAKFTGEYRTAGHLVFCEPNAILEIHNLFQGPLIFLNGHLL